MLGGQGCTRWSVAEDDFARGKANGDRSHRPSRPLRGIHGGAIHVLIVFVDSTSRRMRPYGTKNKSETTAFVKKFVADTSDMGPPKFFRSENGGGYTSNSYVDYCDSVGIRREFTVPGTSQLSIVVESAIWRAPAPWRRLREHSQLRSQRQPVWLEAELWAVDGFNRSATKANTGWRSPSEVLFSRTPELQVVPFFQPGMMRVARDAKSAAQSARCFSLNNGCNHPSSTVKVIRAFTYPPTHA